MRRLIMFIFFVLSGITLAAITLALNDLLSLFGFDTVDIDAIAELIKTSDIKVILLGLGTVLYGLFQLYGFPLIVFLISLNGLLIRRIK